MTTTYTLRSRLFRAVFGYNAKGGGRRARLRVNVLEGREVPATYIVNDPGNGGFGANNQGDLRYCIAQANFFAGDDDISFDPNVFTTATTIALSGSVFAISKDSLSIQGPSPTSAPVTLKRVVAERFFDINIGEDREFTLLNLTLTDGVAVIGSQSGNGGAITIGSGIMCLFDCTIANNTAQGNGGAIYSTDSEVHLERTAVSDNSAAGNGGGIWCTDAYVTIDDSDINSNTTSGDGAGIFADNAEIVVANEASLQGNTAAGNGGGILAMGSEVFIDDALISNNIANGGNGGGVYAGPGSTLTVTGISSSTTVGGNTAAGSGGGIFSLVPTTISNSDFNSNMADLGGGINVESSNSSLTLTDCNFDGISTRPNEGAGIRLANVSTSIKSVLTDATFYESYSIIRGGGISIVGTGLVDLVSTVEPSATVQGEFWFESGGATGENSKGGGIYIGTLSGASPTVNMSKLRIGQHFSPSPDDGQFASYGGNIAIEGGSPTITMSDCIIDGGNSHDVGNVGNAKMLNGGNIYIGDTTGGVITFTNTVIADSEGIIDQFNNIVDVTDYGAGVAIVDSQSTVTFTKCDISANTADILGGGVYITGGSGTVTLSASTIEFNEALSGGGICIGDGSSTVGTNITVRACTVHANTATGDDTVGPIGGGGITINQATHVVVKNSTLDANFAELFGGGIYFPNSIVHDTTYNIRNCTIWGNEADRGGGIFVDGQNFGTTQLKVYNSTIAANAATNSFDTNDGGGIGFLRFSSTDNIFLSSTIVATNKASTTDLNEGPDIGGPGAKSVTASRSLIGVADDGGWTFASDSQNQKGTRQSPLSPGFASAGLTNNGGLTRTVALAVGSAAVNNGENLLNLTSDQRGDDTATLYPRVHGTYADIGAFESDFEEDI